jgi:hypothetical protein
MSLFNPWVLLGLLVAFLGALGGGYTKGRHDMRVKQELEIASLNAQARQKEQALVAAVNTQTTQLVKAQNDAKILSQKRNTAIDTGALKLRIPVKTICAVSATADPTPSSGLDGGTAEIQPEFAKAILAIGDEADTTVRKLNACLAIYNQTREMINVKK